LQKHYGDEWVSKPLYKQLAQRFPRKGYGLSLVVICHLAIQMIKRLEDLHAIGFVHRDLKPKNIVVNLQNPQEFNLIDLGLAEKWELPAMDNNGFVEVDKLG